MSRKFVGFYDGMPVCDDGSVWRLIWEFDRRVWIELPPIPGTQRDEELSRLRERETDLSGREI